MVWFTHPHIEAGVTEGLAENAPENDPARMDMLNDLVRGVVALQEPSRPGRSRGPHALHARKGR